MRSVYFRDEVGVGEGRDRLLMHDGAYVMGQDSRDGIEMAE